MCSISVICFGRRRGIAPFLLGLWKNEYFFVFYTFKDSLFAVNQSLMFTNSLCTTVKGCLMSLWLKKGKHHRQNITGSNKRDAFGRLLTYTRNRSGPRIDPWGTPQITYLRSVLLFSTYFNVLLSIR